MTIYKIGKNTEDFFKQSSVLVEIESFNEDKNLRSLDLIGQDITPLIDIYSLDTPRFDTVKIETDEYNLIMNLKNKNQIDYYKLVRVNKRKR
jgi:hypothetical protein